VKATLKMITWLTVLMNGRLSHNDFEAFEGTLRAH